MKKRSKLILSTAGVFVLVVCALVFIVGSKDRDEAELPRVTVTRGTIIEKALAVGTIEPENEVSVKSKVTGVVSRIFADAGTYVRAGQPLLEVRPDPTPLELADARRNVELAEVELTALRKERTRQESLVAKQLISNREYEDFQKRYDEADLRLKIARERLALLESGRVRIGNRNIESIIKAPIDGYVLSKTVEVGDPVTPLTSFQEGTVLMKMANMKRLIFKGTVDEIDVGKLKEGMEVELKVGALPHDTIRGVLSKISLKAEKKEQATVFPIEIAIPQTRGSTLRAGYSANADIIIQKKTNVVMIPERVVTFRHDSAFVRVPHPGGTSEDRFIKTGLSDAINIEVLAGLQEGDEVEEKPLKKIE
jgi:HlyD family secretion protein